MLHPSGVVLSVEEQVISIHIFLNLVLYTLWLWTSDPNTTITTTTDISYSQGPTAQQPTLKYNLTTN